MNRKLIFLLYFIIALPYVCKAQSEIIVNHYTIEEGLPNNTVYASLKDKDGFFWFGTWHGLCAFDGLKFYSYSKRKNQESDIPPRKVVTVVEDNKGYLWIRNIDNRLYLFNKRTEKYYEIYKEIKRQSQNVQVTKIQLMDNGNILVTTKNKNLYEAFVNAAGNVTVEQVYNSGFNIDPVTMKLRNNVLCENNHNIFWIGKDYTIDAVEKNDKTRRLLSIIPKNKTITFFKHTVNHILIATSTGDIYDINRTNGKVMRTTLPSATYISSLAMTRGVIYASTSDGVFAVKGKSATRINTLTSASQMFVDKYGIIWMYHNDSRISCFNPTDGSSQSFPISNVERSITELEFQDAGANGLFILMRDGKIMKYDRRNKTFSNLDNCKEIEGEDTNQRFADIYYSNDQLWLSSTTHGIYQISFTPDNFKYIFKDVLPLTETNSPSNGVRSIFQIKNGDIIAGDRNGRLFFFDKNTNDVKKSFTNIGNVYDITEDNKGNLWFSTKGEGLIKATPDNSSPQGYHLEHFRNNPVNKYSLSNDKVYFTYQDDKGRIWVCTFGGGLNLISEYEGKTIFINKNNAFKKSYPKYDLYMSIRSMIQDKNNRYWIATTDGLMSFEGTFSQYDDIKFETYRDSKSSEMIDNDIYTLHKDHTGKLWISIFGGGLNTLEGYDAEHHRPILKPVQMFEQPGSNVISSIVEDKQHGIWFFTETGICSMSNGSKVIRTYDRFAGFPKTNIEDNTAICLNDGRILVGTRQGVLAFNPNVVEAKNHRQFSTYIMDFKVQNKSLWDFSPAIYKGSVTFADKIELKYDQATFTIEFATLKYTDDSQTTYSYFLEGYDEQWHNNGNNRIASYANVPHGEYKFHVKPNDGISPERTLIIKILPPWWATWWAYCIYLLLIIAAIYGTMKLVLYMIRMRNEVYINDRLAELKIRFFTNVSHELRTPLTLIKDPIEELKKTEKLSPSGKEYLKLIDNNAHKMLQLVNQILDFRKVQNGKMKMHIMHSDINETLEMFHQEFRVMADERGIAYRFEMPEEHIKAWCDIEKIGVVLNNIITNAFKHTQNGGTVCVALEGDDDKKMCRIRIEDDGVTIPKTQLEMIFDRFSQADNKTDDTAHTGTGIGLSLAREYVNMHHGKIWAENLSEDKGAVFIVEIPTDKEHFKDEDIEIYYNDNTAASKQETTEMETAPETAEIIHMESKPTILLIEDNLDLCRMMSLQLKGKFNLYIANDGEEGLKKIYQYHPDIVVSDLMMPVMDGMEVLRRIRRDFNISHIPVIILTAKIGEDVQIEAVNTGANAYITKPFSSEYLTAKINQLIEEQRIFQRKIMLESKDVTTEDNSKKDEYEQHLVKKDLEFIKNIHEIIENNLNESNFNIDTIAESIGLSRSAFFKKLKSLTGFAPVDLVKEIRLSKAADMIEMSDDSLSEIAYSVGFRDSGYFSKCFRKKYGMSPKEYRNTKHQ